MTSSRLRSPRRRFAVASLVPVVALVAASCASTSTTTEVSTSEASPAAAESVTSSTGIDLTMFADGALVGEPSTVDCTLSGGAETSCYEITIAGYPADREIGPFCPDTNSP